MEKIKPRITDFKNDLVFKYLLSNMKDEYMGHFRLWNNCE